MCVPIQIPVAPATEPLRLGEWSVDVGEHVEAGDCLAELIAPGFTLELLAPAAGTVSEFHRQPDQPVASGEVVGWISSKFH